MIRGPVRVPNEGKTMLQLLNPSGPLPGQLILQLFLEVRPGKLDVELYQLA